MSKTLLFGALDWGLGHATRSIPVLRYFSERGWKLVIAANEGTKQILQEAFPSAQLVEPPAYNVKYSKQPSFLTIRLLQQAPKIRRVILEEKRWVEAFVSEHPVDLILSDNRYGFYHPSVPSWIITHQLSPLSGMGKAADSLIRRLHYKLLRPFGHILVPDIQEGDGIAGVLSHPTSLPPNTHYIGLLSRLPTLEVPTLEVPTLEVLVVLSGPEPTRSLFEDMLRKQLRQFKGRYLLVRGLPHVSSGQLEHELNYADPQTLKALMGNADMVICRSGYSSVMDLLAIQQKALLVPTPGQTEQLYLADHLEKNGYFPTLRQEAFDLGKAIQKAKAFDPPKMDQAFELYKPVIEALVHELENKSTYSRTLC